MTNTKNEKAPVVDEIGNSTSKNLLYVLTCEGVYRHEILGIFSDKEIAISKAELLILEEEDGYHKIFIGVCPMNAVIEDTKTTIKFTRTENSYRGEAKAFKRIDIQHPDPPANTKKIMKKPIKLWLDDIEDGANNIINPNHCKCGIPWEEPCKCPEKILEAFTDHIEQQIFHFEDFKKWLVNIYGDNCSKLSNTVLGLNGVEKLANNTYRSPYEVNSCKST